MIVRSTLERRAHLPLLLENPSIIEVGVYRGDFSTQLYMHSPKRLHLVDPWNSAICEGHVTATAEDFEYVKDLFKDCHSVKFHQNYSQQASLEFDDGYADLVYLDGDHSYDAVLADIDCWWPKVRKGGILAGHDIFVVDHIGVTQAVLEIFHNHAVYLIRGDVDPITGHHTNAPSWYVFK